MPHPLVSKKKCFLWKWLNWLTSVGKICRTQNIRRQCVCVNINGAQNVFERTETVMRPALTKG
jgi:hypothetical protein